MLMVMEVGISPGSCSTSKSRWHFQHECQGALVQLLTFFVLHVLADAVVVPHRDAVDEVPPRYLPHLLGPLLVLLALMLLLLALPAQIPEALTQVCDDGCMLFNLHLNPSGVHFDLLGQNALAHLLVVRRSMGFSL